MSTDAELLAQLDAIITANPEALLTSEVSVRGHRRVFRDIMAERDKVAERLRKANSINIFCHVLRDC